MSSLSAPAAPDMPAARHDRGIDGAVAMSAFDSHLTARSPLYERLRWRIFSITWLAYFGFYLTRKSFSVAKVPLSQPEWGWTKIDMSWAEGGLLTAYAVGQFLFGVLGDRYGARKVVLAGLFLSVVTAAMCGMFSAFWILAPLLCLQGLWQATGWSPLAKNMGEFFSQRERGWVMGLWMTNYAVGGFVAVALAGAAAQQWGWRAAFLAPAAVLGVIWLLFLIFQVNRPEDAGLPAIEQYHGEPVAIIDPTLPEAAEPTWQTIQVVLESRMVWLLAGVYFFVKPTRYLLLAWSPLYLSEKLQTSVDFSGYLSGLFDLAGVFSVIAGGFVSDRLFRSRRMPICFMALLASGVLLLFLDHLPASRTAFGAALFALGFLIYIPDSLVSGTAAIDFGTKQGASTAAGFICGVGSVAAVIGGTLPGLVESVVGEGTYIWNYVFVSLAISLFIAALLILPHWNALPATATNLGRGRKPA